MKILYHHRIASKDGQYVHIEEMISSLRKIGHEVVVVEPARLTKKDFGKSSGAVQSLRNYLPGFIHELIEFSYCFFDFVKLILSIIKHRPDCIYERYNLFFISGILAKKIYKLPLVLEVNAPLFFERQTNHGIQLKSLAKWSERWVWRQADFVLPVTQILAQMILAEKVNPNKCLVIPNGVNKTKFSENNSGEDIKKFLGLQGKLVLGFVGFVRTWHRLDRVLLSISENLDKNWHLLLIGDGPAMQELQQQSEGLGIMDRVSFVGVVDRHKVADYVNAFDIALQPDVVEYASPLKLFEYMALGKAILAPNRKNILEILIDNKNALLFNPEEDASFSSQLERLCSSKELRDSLGGMASKTIADKKLFWDENAKKVEGVFLKLFSEK